ncbi:MAG: hypothetical protein KF760_16000 [Candidatus Eremiobacteraeota bacterium]|nr:hypothetical protein [Candidatus Eremiobacteraeota bacterium]MCW5867376.1 hypothetical protein [Candidatus Eremiobacteraeota bacterium]
MPEAAAPAEQVIAQVLHRRMEDEKSLIAGERGAVAYRIAELMVHAKDLYTQSLPRLTKEINSELPMEEELTGLRMVLLHMRDLITDFDNAYLDAMFVERKANPEAVYDQWRDPDAEAPGDDGDEWTDEDLGLSEEELS